MLLGGSGHLLGPALRFPGSGFGLDSGEKNLLAAGRQGGDVRSDLVQGRDDCLAGLRIHRSLFGDGLDLRRNGADIGRDPIGHALDIGSALLRRAGQGPHLVGYDREAATFVAGASGLDGGVEGQEVRLVGNLAHHTGDFSDIGGMSLEHGNQFDGSALTDRIGLDCSDRGVDLGASLRQQVLKDFGASAGHRRVVTRFRERCVQLGNRFERFMRGARGLLGRAGNLLRELGVTLSAADEASATPLANSSVADPMRSAASC